MLREMGLLMHDTIAPLATNFWLQALANIGGSVAFAVLLWQNSRRAWSFVRSAYSTSIKAAVARARRRRARRAVRCSADIVLFSAQAFIELTLVILLVVSSIGSLIIGSNACQPHNFSNSGAQDWLGINSIDKYVGNLGLLFSQYLMFRFINLCLTVRRLRIRSMRRARRRR